MKLSLSGKLFGIGAGAYVLGALLERLPMSRNTKGPKAIYTPQNVIGYLTSEQVQSIQHYADTQGIRWWSALEIFCEAWNREHFETHGSHMKGK